MPKPNSQVWDKKYIVGVCAHSHVNGSFYDSIYLTPTLSLTLPLSLVLVQLETAWKDLSEKKIQVSSSNKSVDLETVSFTE